MTRATQPTQSTSQADLESVTITESRPGEVLAALHQSAQAEREFLFASRDAMPDDLILVAWLNSEAVGYIAVSDQRNDGLLVWEHVVTPFHRGHGLGERLLLEATRRTVPGAIVQIDPLAELDTERVADYYCRLGFHHDAAHGHIWATAAEVMQSASQRHAGGIERQAPVADVLVNKTPGVITVDPDTTIRDVISTMNAERIGAIVVSTDGSRVEGIISERDILVGFDLDEHDFLDRPAREVVTADVVTCISHDPISEVMERMTRQRIRHMPVTTTGRLVGIVSIGDLVNYRLSQLEQQIAIPSRSNQKGQP